MSKGDRASVWEDGKVVAVDGWDGLATVWMHKMLLNCPLKQGFAW